ncbi:MAG: hypothetical protein IKY22_10385 [Bacteroidales bacterium]|nr:hypothetical protein [Bacteroidales bacterium]
MKRLNLNNHWIAIGVLFVMAVTIAVIAYLLAFRCHQLSCNTTKILGVAVWLVWFVGVVIYICRQKLYKNKSEFVVLSLIYLLSILYIIFFRYGILLGLFVFSVQNLLLIVSWTMTENVYKQFLWCANVLFVTAADSLITGFMYFNCVSSDIGTLLVTFYAAISVIVIVFLTSTVLLYLKS